MATKVIALLKRRLETPLESFQAAACEGARRQPPPQGCSRYVQSHTLARGYRKGELLADVVEEYWFEDPADARLYLLARGRAHEAIAGLVDPQQSTVLLVQPHVVKNELVPAGAVKNIEFVTRRPGMASEPFFRYWRDVHGPLGATIPSILRYEQNHAVEGDSVAGRQRYDGLAITWFESTAAMRSGAETEAYRVTRADEANFLPDGHLPIIITTEVLDTGPI